MKKQKVKAKEKKGLKAEEGEQEENLGFQGMRKRRRGEEETGGYFTKEENSPPFQEGVQLTPCSEGDGGDKEKKRKKDKKIKQKAKEVEDEAVEETRENEEGEDEMNRRDRKESKNKEEKGKKVEPHETKGQDEEEGQKATEEEEREGEDENANIQAMLAPLLEDGISDKSGKSSMEGRGGEGGKAPPVLAWMRAPLEIGNLENVPLERVKGMDSRLRSALEEAGFHALFPVQAAVWSQTVMCTGKGVSSRDLCVCSATGSGKTLAYALPIVQNLCSRIVPRLRALIVLPTRDLAVQVKKVFDLICPAVGLKAGVAVGQTSLAWEATQIMEEPDSETHLFYPFSNGDSGEHSAERKCKVDILVATPGRLMDHLHETAGFTLNHLRYLVVDESDRLLRQAYQDWLPSVLAALRTHCAPTHTTGNINRSSNSNTNTNNSNSNSGRNSSGDGSDMRRRTGDERLWDCDLSLRRGKQGPEVLKIALSATLTRDPAKIGRLGLHHPLYIAASSSDHRYKLPSQLQEFKMVCEAGEKPLYLVALLGKLRAESTIVFTASVQATHRLYLLLCAFSSLSPSHSLSVVEYSSLQHQRARSEALEKFRSGKAKVLVASDAMTRGMDVESVGNVVSYDVPVYAKTYVHRVGRTARAGKRGTAFTILRKEEVRHFKGLLRKADNRFCQNYELDVSEVEELVPQYKAALAVLKQRVDEEEAVAHNKTLPSPHRT